LIKGVVFDLDGVIVNTPDIYFKTMKEYIRGHSVKVKDEDVSKLIGYSLRDELMLINQKYGLNIELSEFVSVVLSKSRKLMEKEMKVNDGFTELLSELKENRFKTAVASNNVPSTIDFILSKYGFLESFDAIVGADDVKHGKPSPEIYIKAVEKLGLKKEECIAIEDTLIGLKAVSAAGLKCIAFPNKFTNGQNLLSKPKQNHGFCGSRKTKGFARRFAKSGLRLKPKVLRGGLRKRSSAKNLFGAVLTIGSLTELNSGVIRGL